MPHKLWKFSDNFGTFQSACADKFKTLYFPLANEKILSCLSPDLHGDIKTGQNHFLLTPVSRTGLIDSRSSRNFWVYLGADKVWSAAGVSKDAKQLAADKFHLEAGLLWHKALRKNKKIGLEAEILSFVPVDDTPVEIMQVKITNISRKKIKFIPTAAIPIYGRGANNLRDHRQVTSLLQRVTLHKYGVIARPTLSFDEAGHTPNKTAYFVLGWDDKFYPPQYLYPTAEMFCGEAGDLEAPESVLKNALPCQEQIQGKEAMGALRFRQTTLAPGQSKTYIMLLGIADSRNDIKNITPKFNRPQKIQDAWQKNKMSWLDISRKTQISTGDTNFDNWFRWVSIQPTLRRIFGCSFLPDFDYGKGGRGWRDLWQDCLSLILTQPRQVRRILINNFCGVRRDGSNATIIGKKQGEFIPDRNNISRVWMDHAIWPLLTLNLYLNETGDYNILFEKAAYFGDRQPHSKISQGTILEHLLVQHLTQFFNIGLHNHIRLQGADWNDGLDMAKDKGESVAFSCMYASNLKLLADLLEKAGKRKIKIAKALKILLGPINYNNLNAKQKILKTYLEKIKITGGREKVIIDSRRLAADLRSKSMWMMRHIRRSEWLKEGFFNGYYDDLCRRVEGKKGSRMRMILTSQVFALISGVAEDKQADKILKSIERYLWDKKLKSFHLNTDFKQEEHHLGRAFSFVYGDKENGAFFNHMIVMYAYALYKRGYVDRGWQALESIYRMAVNTEKSKIYPCLPEYFNLEGRGMYAYLTGSASWFVLTLLTGAFGVKGRSGDLFIEPKLSPAQFKRTSKISIRCVFAQRVFQINFSCPRKLSYARHKIINAALNGKALELDGQKSLLIRRKTILSLPKDSINNLDIALG